MVRPDLAKWGQSLADVRRLSTEADHVRTRERFLALYMIGSGQYSATGWAQESGRTKETVLGWVHEYNREGPAALTYRRTGGRPPFLAQNNAKYS
jgi:transposase